MTDATQRIAEAEQAKQAWDRFVAPALTVIRAEYLTKLAQVAVQPMEGKPLAAVQSLSVALRVSDQIEGQIKALILDGAAAQQDVTRASRIANIGPEARRYAGY